MSLRTLLLCLAIIVAPAADAQVDPTALPVDILTLGDESVQLMVAPQLGGRLLDLRLHGRASVIRCAWQEVAASGGLDQIAEQRGFVWWYRAYQGQTLWIGPQRDFWNDQDYMPDHAGRNWPPDPFHIWGDYHVVEQSERSLALAGPVSAVTGLQVIKRYELLGGGRVLVRFEVVNRGPRQLRRNCWPLIRVETSTRSYVDVEQIGAYWLDHRGKGAKACEREVIPYTVTGGYLTLMPRAASDREGVAKYFINLRPEAVGVPVAIEAFSRDTRMRIIAEGVAAERIDADHAFIEIFLSTASNTHELEMQGPLHDLAPGDSMVFEQVLELHPYDGPDDMAAHVAVLQAARQAD